MLFVRYSAVEQFGVPIDNPDESIQNSMEILKLVSRYGVEPQPISQETTEITPYYWQKNSYRTFVTLAHPEGPAVVEMLPTSLESNQYLVTRSGLQMVAGEGEIQRMEIPGVADVFPLVGGSPRYAGMLCIHEIIACLQ